MARSGGARDSGLDEKKLERTREKFMQLLNTDRTSVHFERLYAEVDELLSSLLHESESAAQDGTAPEAAQDGSHALTKPRQM